MTQIRTKRIWQWYCNWAQIYEDYARQ